MSTAVVVALLIFVLEVLHLQIVLLLPAAAAAQIILMETPVLEVDLQAETWVLQVTVVLQLMQQVEVN